MKKFNLLLLSASLSFALTGYAADVPVCQSAPGSMTCNQGTVDSINTNGMVTLSGTTVKNDTVINGRVTADKATFNNLKVNGTLDINNSTVEGTVLVSGLLNADKTTFKQKIEIASNVIRFSKSEINEILVDDTQPKVEQKIYLDKTKVNGDITFKSGDGIVYVGKDVEMKGKVVGGKVEKMEK